MNSYSGSKLHWKFQFEIKQSNHLCLELYDFIIINVEVQIKCKCCLILLPFAYCGKGPFPIRGSTRKPPRTHIPMWNSGTQEATWERHVINHSISGRKPRRTHTTWQVHSRQTRRTNETRHTASLFLERHGDTVPTLVFECGVAQPDLTDSIPLGASSKLCLPANLILSLLVLDCNSTQTNLSHLFMHAPPLRL